MKCAENIRDIETLRQYTICLKRAYLDLLEKQKKQDNLESQRWLSEKLEDQISRLQKKFFGFGREELTPRANRPVGHSKQQLLLHGDRPQDEISAKEISSRITKEEKNRDQVYYTFEEKELQMESKSRDIQPPSNTNWNQVKDFFQDSAEITITERIYKKVTHRQAKYRLKNEFNTTGKEVIITAPGPAKLKAGCSYSIDFALAVVSDNDGISG